jgi:uncharacterized protein CbrC (UPF0167 family)
MPGLAEAQVTFVRARTPRCRRWSSARYMIFCGAPAHFTGVDGKVNTALPDCSPRRNFQVESTRS